MNKLEQKDLIIEALTEAITNKNITIAKQQFVIRKLESIISSYENPKKQKAV